MGPGGRLRALLIALVLVLGTSSALVVRSAPPAAAALPTGFTEVTAFRGLAEPTAVRFAPDGRIFVAEKRGTIVMFAGLGDTTPTRVADLRTEVHNLWDRGLLGLAVDPGFPTRPYLYALYTFDGPVGGTAPRWGTAGTDSDPCPTPPGPTADGCVVSGKLVKLTLSGTTTTKRDLIHDWCQQYPSHSVGDVVFGRDGALYASAGDGASFTWVDYGQDGSPVNPCGDPPAGAGGTMTAPSAQGGALRSQDLRTPTDPVTLDGSVIRVHPDTGAALPDNPAAGATDANARRIVAYGLRNPFRLTPRPGTGEIWLGDVGWGAWEEIDRIAAPTARVTNFGWPCLEGRARQAGYDGADLTVCENLYAQASADTEPYYAYPHRTAVSSSDSCTYSGGSSASGVAFYAGGPYPAGYDGALFFADYSRRCIWFMPRGADGLPDRTKVRPFVSGAAGPVDLEVSPQGELFYVDLVGGTVRRLVYGSGGPTSCPVGQYLAEYFTGTTPTGTPVLRACEAAPLAHGWGTGAPPGIGPDAFSARWRGTFAFPASATYTFTAVTDDGMRVWVDGVLLIDGWRNQPATTYTASRALSAGEHTVRVEWYESSGSATARLDWAGPPNAPPQPSITSPVSGTTWRVGDPITFSGSATDAEDGTLPASRLTWEAVLQHCPDACHAHPLQQWSGVPGGSFTAPDHEYPAYLELRLTATDSSGRSATVSRRLDPRTAQVTLASSPPGLRLGLGQETPVAPFTRTLIVGATASVSAPSPQNLDGATYAFGRWSDGGARSHNVTVGSTATTHTATYTLTACPRGQYRAQYYAGTSLSGTPAINRCEAAPLDRAWGTGGPGGVGVDHFSARWSGSFWMSAGTKTFTAVHDDGMRVWLDGVLIMDRWWTKGTGKATRSVAAGVHTVRVQYVERTGSASARLTW